jgi:hypothetical protein
VKAGLYAWWCGTESTGAVSIDSMGCTCAYPDCGGYPTHEPWCGRELVGYLPREAAVMPDPDPWYGTHYDGESDLLPTMLWDFAGLEIWP